MIGRVTKRVLWIAGILLAVYLVLAAAVFFSQRSLLYFPAHHTGSSKLIPWRDGQRTIGYCREVPGVRTIWLMTHGNAGQAADRDYVLDRMSDEDALYVLEYPGYGSREGRPCLESINEAAAEAYHLLRSQHTGIPICVLGESIGSGPACSLAQEKIPPDKLVLVVPFDSLASVAAEKFYFLPVRLMLLDAWNNVEALKLYTGPVDIFGAVADDIIPLEHAKALATHTARANFIAIQGGHNDWAANHQVKIRR